MMENKILNYLKKQNYLENTLLVSVVGSRMWQMEHENSDWDLFIVVNDPLDKMLRVDYQPTNKEFKINLDGIELDIKIKEIKEVLRQVYTNNPNFIFGVLSDYVIYEQDKTLINGLRYITYENINYQIFPPLKGMINHNYKKYFVNKVHDKSGKKEIIIKKIAWLCRCLSIEPRSSLPFILPPSFNHLENGNKDIKNLKLAELVKLIKDLEIPSWSKFENNIEDFNQFLYKIKTNSLK